MRGEVSLIRSRHNPQFKRWLKLASRPQDRGCPWVPVEGWKQVEQLSLQRPIELLLFSNSDPSRRASLSTLRARSSQVVCLRPSLLEALSSVQSPQGMVAFFKKPLWSWDHFTPFVLYLDRLQDPGNLGTLLRTAQASGIFSVVTSPGTVSCYHPKVIRASATTLFSTPFLEGVAVEELRRRGYRLWAATARTGISLFEAKLEPPLAVLLGNEGRGLRKSLLTADVGQLYVPMQGDTESLNAAVAGSLILFEAVRQNRPHG